MRFSIALHLLLCLLFLSPLHAAKLDGNKITADGTYTVATIPGKKYTFAAGGTFGNGSLALNWRDALGNTGAVFGSPAISAKTFTFTASTSQVDLVLTGSTAPVISITLALADGSGAGTPTAGDIINALGYTPDPTQAVSVRSFGAKGDGVADDTAAIQAAADTGKNVYFPSGTGKYKITAKITLNHIGATPGVPVLVGQKFFGDGPTRSIIYQATSSAHIFDVTQASSMYLQVDGLGFEGTGGNSSTGYGIASTTGPGPHNSWKITNCYFYWLNKGIGAGIEDSFVTNCTFDSCVVGIDMMNAGGAAINQNTLYNNIIVYQTGSKYPTVPGVGIRVNGGYGHKIIGLDMGNTGMVTAIELNGNSGGEISGMSTEMFPYTGQLVSCINGTNAGISQWTVTNSNLVGFGAMNAGDYPIVQGRFVTLTLNNVSCTGSWTAGHVKRLSANELNSCTLEAIGIKPKIDIVSGANVLLDSYQASAINENGTAIIPTPVAANRGKLLSRSGLGGGDDELFRFSQRAGGTYDLDNLLQYGTDDRAGRFSQLSYVSQSVVGVTASADSSYLTNTPDRTIDSNVGTEWWHNGPVNTGSPFLKYDFGVGSAPKITKLLFHNTTVAILNVVVQGSNDNSTWTTVGNFRKYSVGSSQHLIAPTIGYRYYRLNFSSLDNAWLQVAEVGFFRSIVQGDIVGTIDGQTSTVTKIPMTVSNDADFSTTSTSFVNVTGLSFPVLPNKNYAITINLATNKSDANGLQIQLTGPSSPVRVLVRYGGSGASNNAFTTDFITAYASAVTTFNTFAGDGAIGSVIAQISNGPNAGTVQLQLRAVTGGTAKIYAGSWIQVTQLN